MNTTIQEEVASAMPDILARIKREALETMQKRCLEVAVDEATKAARDWAIENLVPEIRAQLDAGKAGMVAQAQECAKKIGEAVGEALAANAVKSLATSYNARQVAELIFKGY